MKKLNIVKRLGSLILLVFISTCLYSQDIAFEKSNFKDDPKGFKQALKKYEEGNMLFVRHRYEEALENYLEAYSFNSESARLNADIGELFLKTVNKNNAVPYLSKAIKLNPDLDGYYIYLLGQAHHFQYNFNEAVDFYKKAKLKGSKINQSPLENIDRLIEECNNGKLLVADSVNVKIEALPASINTANQEYVPIINADETTMLFTSRRAANLGGEKDEYINDYYEDIYQSIKVNGEWSEAKNLGKPVNSIRHDATIALSVDGQSLFLYRDNEKGNGDIYMSKLQGDKWADPIALPAPINSDAQETSACFSPDEKTIYFVSNRDGGSGGKDIYYSKQSKNGKWGIAKPLKKLNTQYDEDAVFMHPDGKTLYFSSKGLDGMGGYDIYTSELKGRSSWSKPKNIGYPINSTGDDVSIVLNAAGTHGFYTSERVGGFGKRDIYKITFLEESVKPKVTLLKGVIRDEQTREPIEADIELYDNTNNIEVAQFKSNAVTGKYMVSIPSGSNYGIFVKAKGYLFHSETFHIDSTQLYQEIEKNIDLNKLEVGTKIVLNNIFYDYGKATLRKDSHHELDIVVQLLKENIDLRIELSSHTDSRGNETYNQNLSEQRAASCAQYLINHGISDERIEVKGFGEQDLLYTDKAIEAETSEERREAMHQANRRTEFKIID